MGGVTHSLDSGIHYTLFHHTLDLLDRERKNSAKISPLEGAADVMFERGTGFTTLPPFQTTPTWITVSL